MSRGVKWLLFGSLAVAALVALAGCGHYFYAGEREAWRHDAEVACLNSSAVKETPERVRIAAISGPGICGADYPLRVSALGEGAPLGYDDEPLRPPSSVPAGAMPQSWPGAQAAPAYPMPPPSAQPAPFVPAPPSPYGPPAPYRPQAPDVQQAGAPLSLTPPGVSQEAYPAAYPQTPAPPLGAGQYVPPTSSPPALGPSSGPPVTGAIGPVELKPAATLACPIVSALDQWIGLAVQPAALKWFRAPVVEIKQISAYSCRGMNGNPNARISEHAFGNALDIAEFTLADGHRISVQYGWRGTPEEQGFLRDVQAAACAEFTTVLAPGANVYHYNHIHVDLMRHASGRHICEPSAIPGEVVAERARARYAAQHDGEGGVTGSIKEEPRAGVLGYSSDDDDRRPLAVPGED